MTAPQPNPEPPSIEPMPAKQSAQSHAGTSLDLSATIALHRATAELARRSPAEVAQALHAANDRLAQRDKSFGGLKNLSVSLSALALSRADVAKLAFVAERLHGIVERAVQWIIASPERLDRYAADYRRLFPYFAKTPGAGAWQFASRYDAVVAADGRLSIIELNTGCPAGFMHAAAFTRTTAQALAELGLTPHVSLWEANLFADSAATRHRVSKNNFAPCSINPQAIVDGLLAAEAASGIEPASVALLTDENCLTHELDLMVDDFARRGRPARILDASELTYDGRHLLHRGDAISLTYDKFRISIPTSGNHCWRDGFETRYAAFLAAHRDRRVVAVNNLVAQSIAEDKSLLALLADPAFAGGLSTDDRQFVADHILWTARLAPGEVAWRGQTIDLLSFVAAHRDEFVIKPTCEGRGYGVVVGRDCPAEEWQRLCYDRGVPRIVQDYVEPARLPVICPSASTAEPSSSYAFAQREMFLTLGLATVLGKFQGVLARISPSRITNVAREGFVQAAFACGAP